MVGVVIGVMVGVRFNFRVSVGTGVIIKDGIMVGVRIRHGAIVRRFVVGVWVWVGAMVRMTCLTILSIYMNLKPIISGIRNGIGVRVEVGVGYKDCETTTIEKRRGQGLSRDIQFWKYDNKCTGFTNAKHNSLVTFGYVYLCIHLFFFSFSFLLFLLFISCY